MKNIDLSKVKINLNIVLWIVVVFLLFLVNQMSNNSQLKSDLSKYRKKDKKEIEKNIDNRDKIIEKLEAENRNYKIEIQDMVIKIDSLQRIKRKIQIKTSANKGKVLVMFLTLFYIFL